ncbi:hypothetical protein CONCODRAFT_13135 [Conidiobolus coronatus NRRL 28638]|uniref:Uncharacterized protein n=1 Tax=Conidiobolus coronatus (strain ATCC 28846 / CBS 209.66 / NRRL 28638) TaxID=796925 RepID=A0A137NRG9_CONC2|nr:hypothetical protein CONCODRAFT_13135 [Conidiobolus coronatus NRRL 28638]|eukprot:KXN65314.1 hypothetical protein CONCODRAFT_13135 [Conidiobolus coronatus NRRL 28638]
MNLFSELSYIGSISLITILILDFIVIELVLKLGVFSAGKKWTRILLLFFLFCQTLIVGVYELNRYEDTKILSSLAVIWIIWINLYFNMLIEQNDYWMSDTIRKRMYIAWVVYNLIAVPSGTIVFLVYLYAVSINFFFYANVMGSIILVYLSTVEMYVVFKVYFFSKSKIKPVSTKLWAKVQFRIFICIICVVIDILNAVLETTGFVHYAYLFKPCVFAFKVIFECMCFQFIKGIIFTLD